MADDGIRNPILIFLLWARRLFPYVVFFAGAVFGAAGVIRIFLDGAHTGQPREMAWLGVSLLLYWLAFGLLERNERSWTIYQGAGAILTGALGVALIINNLPDLLAGLQDRDAFAIELGIPWVATGLALAVWSLALLANHGGACFLWQFAILPIALAAFWWWKWMAVQALRGNQSPLIILSALYFGISMTALLVLSRHAYRRSLPPERLKARKSWQNPRSFPSKYHELLARGRLCELFEVPCNTPCPLATAIVAKYQKRRIQYRLYPEILEPFEKAYAILVTPQKRELCKIAHEILQAKEKQLGTKRYEEMEVYLWRTLWERLQDGTYMGEPEKALRDKNRLLREIMPQDEP